MGKSIIVSTNTQKFADKFITSVLADLLIEKNNSTDFITIGIEVGKSSIGIKQMQELKQWSSNKPYFSINKLAVITSAEILTNEAQNSILKLLEEPTDSTHYILVTKNLGKLLPTIISRCELVYDNAESDKLYDISQFIESDQLDRFQYVEKLLKIDDTSQKLAVTETFLISLLDYQRKNMLTLAKAKNKVAETNKAMSDIETISKTFNMICARVPAKTALDYLVMNININ